MSKINPITPSTIAHTLGKGGGKGIFDEDLYGDGDELPSKRMHNSMLGTSLGRKQWKNRNKMDEHAMENAYKRGLKLDADDTAMDEIEQMQQLEIIKNMPVSLSIKRELRERLMQIPTTDKNRGCCSLYCFRAKLGRMRREHACRMYCMDFNHTVTLWSGAFKKIEGHFGSGVLTYFVFLKWLFQLNIFIALMNFLLLILPMIVFSGSDYNSSVTGSSTTTAAVNLSIECSALYTVNATENWYQYILQFIEGSGFMEKTIVFYGYYSASERDITGIDYNYNMPLAYILCIVVYFVVSLCVMVHNTAKGFRERVFMTSGEFNQFSNKVFGGWDYSIEDENNASMIHTSLHRELDSLMEEVKRKKTRDAYTCGQECKLVTIRIVIWILVLAMLGGAGYLIYYVTQRQAELMKGSDFSSYHLIVQLLIQYMTSIVITLLNAILPLIFQFLVKLEDYGGGMSVNITLARTVFLKLASLAILVASMYNAITCSTKDSCLVGTGTCTSYRCWETYVGQEFYKLVLINFFVQIAVVFLVETPRRLIVDKCSCKFAEIIGRQEFDIPKGVLDLIYMEALLWFGGFFSPIIAPMMVATMLVLFYIKYFTVLFNCKPLEFPYRASSSSEFFLITLLITYTLCIVPLVYVIYSITPSTGCGPFRIYSNMYQIIPITIDTWPSGFQSFVSFLTTAAVIVPIFVILCLSIYYVVQVLLTYKSMVVTLKEQLNMESRDKEYLMTKISHLEGKDPKSAKPEMKKQKSAKLKHRNGSALQEDYQSTIEKGLGTKGYQNNGYIHDQANTPPGVPQGEFNDEEQKYLDSF